MVVVGSIDGEAIGAEVGGFLREVVGDGVGDIAGDAAVKRLVGVTLFEVECNPTDTPMAMDAIIRIKIVATMPKQMLLSILYVLLSSGGGGGTSSAAKTNCLSSSILTWISSLTL